MIEPERAGRSMRVLVGQQHAPGRPHVRARAELPPGIVLHRRQRGGHEDGEKRQQRQQPVVGTGARNVTRDRIADDSMMCAVWHEQQRRIRRWPIPK